MVTTYGCDVKIRSVVNTPMEIAHGVAYKPHGTEIQILPKIDGGGVTFSGRSPEYHLDILTNLGTRTGIVALNCNGLVEDEAIFSLVSENGDEPVVFQKTTGFSVALHDFIQCS